MRTFYPGSIIGHVMGGNRNGRRCKAGSSERGYIAEALQRAGGVQVKAADLLGMSFRSFRYYVKKYNLR